MEFVKLGNGGNFHSSLYHRFLRTMVSVCFFFTLFPFPPFVENILILRCFVCLLFLQS